MATFTNQASLTYNNRVYNSNIVTGEYVGVLSATKSATTTGYNSSDTLTYLISIVNSGPDSIQNVIISDNLGAYSFTPVGGTAITLVPLDYQTDSVLYYVNGILQSPSPTVTDDNPLTITGITVPAGGNVLILYRAALNAYAPLNPGSVITNIATITGGGLAAPITATNTLAVNPDPQLSISKSMNPLTVVENGTLTYTFVIENAGNTPADSTAGLVVKDTFDPVLYGISAKLNNVVFPQANNWTYNGRDFATLPGVITVGGATYTQDPVTGAYTVTPGYTTLSVTGKI